MKKTSKRIAWQGVRGFGKRSISEIAGKDSTLLRSTVIHILKGCDTRKNEYEAWIAQ